MEWQGRALYNLLRTTWREDQTISVQPWQVEDYRSLSKKALFERMAKFKIPLSEEIFLQYAQNCSSPEELVELLWLDEEDVEGHDQAYLLLFELWRRLLPDKQSLSLFCDELDSLMDLYDAGTLEDEEKLQQALSDLEDILDLHADKGNTPPEVFAVVSQYCAHDLESFLYDYISEQIEQENDLLASELLDGFYPYMPDPRWFELLRSRLFLAADPKDANKLLSCLLEEVQENPDSSLSLEIVQLLAHSGDPALFMRAVKQTYPLLTHEEELHDLLNSVADFYRCLDREKEEQAIQAILTKRMDKDLSKTFDHTEKDLLSFKTLLDKSDGSKI